MERRRTNDGKSWYKSKTILVNLGAFFMGVTPLLASFDGLISPLAYAIAFTCLGIINVGLRVVTTGPIDVSKGKTARSGSGDT